MSEKYYLPFQLGETQYILPSIQKQGGKVGVNIGDERSLPSEENFIVKCIILVSVQGSQTQSCNRLNLIQITS